MNWWRKMREKAMQSRSDAAINLRSLKWEAFDKLFLRLFKKNRRKKKGRSWGQITSWKYSGLFSWLLKVAFSTLFWIWNSVNYKNVSMLSPHLHKYLLKYQTWVFDPIHFQHSLTVGDILKLLGQCTTILFFTQHWSLTLKLHHGIIEWLELNGSQVSSSSNPSGIGRKCCKSVVFSLKAFCSLSEDCASWSQSSLFRSVVSQSDLLYTLCSMC